MKISILYTLLFTHFLLSFSFISNAELIVPADIVEGQDSQKNFIGRKGHFAKNANGVNGYKDAAGVSAVDGTGGAPTLTCTRSVTTPISGDGQLLITKTAANLQGEGCSIDFTIDSGNKTYMHAIDFQYLIPSGTFTAGTSGSSATASDIIVQIYDVTNAVIIPVQGTGYLYSNSSTIADNFRGYFQAASNSTSYRLILHTQASTTVAFTMGVDNIKVSKSNYVYGTPISDWVAYTPTGSWTANTTYTGFKRRVGGNAEYKVKIALAGAPTSANLSINQPSGETIDTTKVLDTANDYTYGVWNVLDAATANYTGVISYNNTTSVNLRAIGTAGTYTNDVGAVTQAVPITFGDSDAITMVYSVPILGWSAGVQQSDGYDARQIGFRANNSATSINGTPAKIVWTNTDKDDVAGYSSGTYTVRSSGWYGVAATLYVSGTPVVDSNTTISIYRNGASVKDFVYRYKVASATTASIPISDAFYFNSGDTIEIFASSDMTSPSISSSTTRNIFTVNKKQAPTTISATERVFVLRGSTSGQSILADTDTKLQYATNEEDTHGGWSTSNHDYEARYPGVYQVSGLVKTSGAENVTVGQIFRVRIFVDGVFNKEIWFNRYIDSETGVEQSANFNGDVKVTAGQKISIVLLSTVACALNTGAGNNWMSIKLVK